MHACAPSSRSCSRARSRSRRPPSRPRTRGSRARSRSRAIRSCGSRRAGARPRSSRRAGNCSCCRRPEPAPTATIWRRARHRAGSAARVHELRLHAQSRPRRAAGRPADWRGSAVRPLRRVLYPRENFNQRFQLRGTVLAVGGARADGVFDLADGTSRTNLGDISAAAGRFAVVEDRFRPAPRRLADRRRRSAASATSTSIRSPTTSDWARTARSRGSARGPGAAPRRPPAAGRRAGQRLHHPAADRRQPARGAPDRARRHVPDAASARSTAAARARSMARRGRSHDPRRTEFGWAFDGARVAWVAQPCALPTIQVWDLAGIRRRPSLRPAA